jgi:hypothetical protein
MSHFQVKGYAPSRIRTCDLLLRRESLYPAELSGLVAKGIRALGRVEGLPGQS